MSLSEEPSWRASPQAALGEDEERIAAAVVAALNPRLVAILERLDGVDKQLATINALVVANHEDTKAVQNKLSAFQEENNKAWEANREVMNRLATDVTYLMDR